ncbi:MAG: hypothetical protein KTR24_13210 [Saprospiraceae bacterium]|nr:hypothetical protein [Saprospiraceae bacterium]
MNNFQRLSEEEERGLEEVPGSIREEIESSRNIFSFIGSITDLFIPKLLMLLTGMLGGGKNPKSPDADEDKPHRYPHLEA